MDVIGEVMGRPSEGCEHREARHRTTGICHIALAGLAHGAMIAILAALGSLFCPASSATAAQYLVICADGMEAAADSLCRHRETVSANCYDRHAIVADYIHVQDVDEVYGDGDNLIEAVDIASCIAAMHGTGGLEYVVLMGIGKASPQVGDYSFVPVYHQGSPDLDEPYVDFDADGLEDVPIGRLPAKTGAAAMNMVRKIIVHDTSRWADATDAWRYHVFFSGYDFDWAGVGGGGVVYGRTVREFAEYFENHVLSESASECGAPDICVATGLGDREDDIARLAHAASELNAGCGIWVAYGTTANFSSTVRFVSSSHANGGTFDNRAKCPLLIGASCTIAAGMEGWNDANVAVDLLELDEAGIIGCVAASSAVDQRTSAAFVIELMRTLGAAPLCGAREIGEAVVAAKAVYGTRFLGHNVELIHAATSA